MRAFWLILVFTLLGMAMEHTIKHEVKHTSCTSETTKHGVIWEAYVAESNTGEVRCFWKEQNYPWRVKQGTPV